MGDKEIVKLIAEQVMGWQEWPNEADAGFLVEADGSCTVIHARGEFPVRWNPLTSIEAAFSMQRAIEMAGLFSRYVRQLYRDLQAESLGALEDDEDLWAAFVKASARQRCEAAIGMLASAPPASKPEEERQYAKKRIS